MIAMEVMHLLPRLDADRHRGPRLAARHAHARDALGGDRAPGRLPGVPASRRMTDELPPEAGLDLRLAKALAHPVRQQLLMAYNQAVTSPSELAVKLGRPLNEVAYHTKRLLEMECVELVRDRARAPASSTSTGRRCARRSALPVGGVSGPVGRRRVVCARRRRHRRQPPARRRRRAAGPTACAPPPVRCRWRCSAAPTSGAGAHDRHARSCPTTPFGAHRQLLALIDDRRDGARRARSRRCRCRPPSASAARHRHEAPARAAPRRGRRARPRARLVLRALRPAPPQPIAAPPASRVCGHCGLGLVLQAAADLAPRARRAVSRRRHDAVGLRGVRRGRGAASASTRPTPSTSTSPTSSCRPTPTRPSAENLLALLVDVAAGSGEPCTAVVRPRQEFGVRFRARIGPCGPPHAACSCSR